jgi:hypothetical protein
MISKIITYQETKYLKILKLSIFQIMILSVYILLNYWVNAFASKNVGVNTRSLKK